VVQWGIAYAAGAWGFLQGLEYATQTFHWPEQFQQLATLALLIGLPIVLVIAWFHGDRGHRRVSRIELALLTLLFLLGGGLFWRYQHTSETASVATPPALLAAAAVIRDDKSIAVLPFVNMSSDQEQEYFSDGLSEELLNLLAQVPQLRVIARTSSFSFKGKEADITEIARKLNVAHVLEGSVRKSGDTLRITAQLIRTADSSHLWSQTYDRPMTDVFKVQDEIAAAVVAQLKINLLGRSPKSKVTDPKAYALYLQARQVGSQYTAAAFERAISLYQQALALDPGLAAAWVGLARMYCYQVLEGLRLTDAGIQLARKATAKALALDPQNAAAYACLGWIAIYYDRDLKTAAQHLEHALALDPSNLDTIGTAAVLARRLGRLDQAIALGGFVVALDPVNFNAHSDLGLAYGYSGRLDHAIAEYRTALALSPEYLGGHALISEALLRQGDPEAAVVELQSEVDESWRLTESALADHALGHSKKSNAALDELIKKYGNVYPISIASVTAFRGEADRAFEWLDKAVQSHDPNFGSIPFDPFFTNIHADPRWSLFLRKNGMAPEQLAAIKFDVKLPQ
jgi:TolB-like protein/Flp pilus assembly protein TadD